MSGRGTQAVNGGKEAAPGSVAEAGLPHPQTRRWVARRKAEVVSAVRAGALSFDEACRRYDLSAEELASWQQAIDLHGVGGLRVTLLDRPGRRARRT